MTTRNKGSAIACAIYEAVNFSNHRLEKLIKGADIYLIILKGLANFNDVKILSGADGEVSAPGSTYLKKG